MKLKSGDIVKILNNYDGVGFQPDYGIVLTTQDSRKETMGAEVLAFENGTLEMLKFGHFCGGGKYFLLHFFIHELEKYEGTTND